MANLETIYLGLKLRNPLIISSSGLTNSIEKLVELEKHGAGAVVLKSLFEEQIKVEGNLILQESSDYPEASDYILSYAKSNSINAYLNLIREAKKTLNIPVIASINCFTSDEWTYIAREIQKSGADAIELNINLIGTNPNVPSAQMEAQYFQIIEAVKACSELPIAVKIGHHFSNLTAFVHQLYYRKTNAVVLFNRFYQPDIDIDTMNFSFGSASVFSQESDFRNTLRWIGILGAQADLIDLSASGGIHNGKTAVKALLAGAKTVQVCSAIYKNGPTEVGKILKEMEDWMDQKKFKKIDEFRGKLNYSHIGNPAIYERSQFMRYFSNHE